jgi:hypothetical protein
MTPNSVKCLMLNVGLLVCLHECWMLNVLIEKNFIFDKKSNVECWMSILHSTFSIWHSQIGSQKKFKFNWMLGWISPQTQRARKKLYTNSKNSIGGIKPFNYDIFDIFYRKYPTFQFSTSVYFSGFWDIFSSFVSFYIQISLILVFTALEKREEWIECWMLNVECPV